MNTFKKKSLYAALAGVSALGVTGAAQAVNVNPDGLGQVLIYPYYTTHATGSGQSPPTRTLLSVVNSTASAKAVKVRFLEGKNSREVLDFNLFLSPLTSGRPRCSRCRMPQVTRTYGAGVATFDKSCTVPVVSNNASAPTGFVNYLFAGVNDDLAGDGLDRTREGYVEIIEMGVPSGSTRWQGYHALRRRAALLRTGPYGANLLTGTQLRPRPGRPVRRHDDDQRPRG